MWLLSLRQLLNPREGFVLGLYWKTGVIINVPEGEVESAPRIVGCRSVGLQEESFALPAVTLCRAKSNERSWYFERPRKEKPLGLWVCFAPVVTVHDL